MRLNGRNIPWGNLAELLTDKARVHGDATFAEVCGETISYAELDRRSRQVAANLTGHGLVKGDRVASFMFNCMEQLVLLFATTRAGLVFTPLNAGLLGDDLIHTLVDSGSRVLVLDSDNQEKMAGLPSEVRAQLDVYVVGQATRAAGIRAFAELMEPTELAADVALAPSDSAVILYTGGTTGRPKGVVLSHFSFVLAGMRYVETFAAKPGERHFTTLPLFHAAAMQFGVLGPLVGDMTTTVDVRFSASNYWNRVREVRANVIDPIGSMLTMLELQPADPRDREHMVRVMPGVTGSVPAEVGGRFSARFGIPMVPIYGLTEAGGVMITAGRLGDAVAGSNGKSHGWAEIMIADEADVPMPVGSVGRILLRPTFPNMFMKQYHADPVKTLACFSNLWFHTGDIGYMDASGNLFFQGREAHWIRRRGENISAYEIEEILMKMPGIAEAVVVPVASELGEDDIKVFIIAQEARPRDPLSVVQWCSTRMAAFKVPRFIEFTDDFPRSVTKREIERGVLRKMSNSNAWDREKESVRRAA